MEHLFLATNAQIKGEYIVMKNTENYSCIRGYIHSTGFVKEPEFISITDFSVDSES